MPPKHKLNLTKLGSFEPARYLDVWQQMLQASPPPFKKITFCFLFCVCVCVCVCVWVGVCVGGCVCGWVCGCVYG